MPHKHLVTRTQAMMSLLDYLAHHKGYAKHHKHLAELSEAYLALFSNDGKTATKAIKHKKHELNHLLHQATLPASSVELGIEEEQNTWHRYTNSIYPSLRKRTPGILKSRQAIGYAENHNPKATFLLIWNYDKGPNRAKWVCDLNLEDAGMTQDQFNELSNHFVNEALHFAPRPPAALALDRPPIALLPGLEDIRSEIMEELHFIFKDEGWEAMFDEDDEQEQDITRLPWRYNQAVSDLVQEPYLPNLEPLHNKVRAVVKELEDAKTINFMNDEFDEPTPVIIGRAIEVTTNHNEDSIVWLFNLESPTDDISSGIWYIDEGSEFDETFITDAFLRYGCKTDPFPTRDMEAHPDHRALCLLLGLESHCEEIAAMLEDAIAADKEYRVALPQTATKRKADSGNGADAPTNAGPSKKTKSVVAVTTNRGRPKTYGGRQTKATKGKAKEVPPTPPQSDSAGEDDTATDDDMDQPEPAPKAKGKGKATAKAPPKKTKAQPRGKAAAAKKGSSSKTAPKAKASAPPTRRSSAHQK